MAPRSHYRTPSLVEELLSAPSSPPLNPTCSSIRHPMRHSSTETGSMLSAVSMSGTSSQQSSIRKSRNPLKRTWQSCKRRANNLISTHVDSILARARLAITAVSLTNPTPKTVDLDLRIVLSVPVPGRCTVSLDEMDVVLYPDHAPVDVHNDDFKDDSDDESSDSDSLPPLASPGSTSTSSTQMPHGMLALRLPRYRLWGNEEAVMNVTGCEARVLDTVLFQQFLGDVVSKETVRFRIVGVAQGQAGLQWRKVADPSETKNLRKSQKRDNEMDKDNKSGVKIRVETKQRVELKGMNSFPGNTLRSARAIIPRGPDGAVLEAVLDLPNPSAVTAELGDLTFHLRLGRISIGYLHLAAVTLRPGSNIVRCRGYITHPGNANATAAAVVNNPGSAPLGSGKVSAPASPVGSPMVRSPTDSPVGSPAATRPASRAPSPSPSVRRKPTHGRAMSFSAADSELMDQVLSAPAESDTNKTPSVSVSPQSPTLGAFPGSAFEKALASPPPPDRPSHGSRRSASWSAAARTARVSGAVLSSIYSIAAEQSAPLTRGRLRVTAVGTMATVAGSPGVRLGYLEDVLGGLEVYCEVPVLRVLMDSVGGLVAALGLVMAGGNASATATATSSAPRSGTRSESGVDAGAVAGLARMVLGRAATA